MIEYYKKRGETPLEALTRLREEIPELKNQTLSYAGRLDPMAEGILPVLVGEEENKNRKEFLHKDKTYTVQFLIGCSSDTGDVLGILSKSNFSFIDDKKIEQALYSLTDIMMQKYPWYSSKPVNGIPLFEYARRGQFDIERPARNVHIYSVENIHIQKVDSKELIEEITEDIQKVVGDFRQQASVEHWRKLIMPDKVSIATCTLTVSSGTYIRALAEELEKKIGVPALVYKLIRTQVF